MQRPRRAICRKLVAHIAFALSWLLLTDLLVAQQRVDDTSSESQVADQSAQVPTDAHTLRVLSYNIHHAEGVDGRLDLERIAKIIQSVRPDIVALQEVDFKVKRSDSVDQPQELARLTGMKAVFGGNIDLEGGKYGNALLTHCEVVRSENHRLPNIDQGEQRGVLDVALKHAGQSLRVLATHFDHRRDPRERLASIDMVNQLLAKEAETPTLLIGDLNAEFSSEVLDRARTQWKLANDERMPTIPVAKPQRQIDFILCAPPQRWQTTEFKVLEETKASDHRPVFSALKF